MEGWSEASAEELWDRHRERVAEIRVDEATSLLPHDTMDLRLRIAERCTAVAHFVVAFALLSAFFAFVGMGILWLEAMSWFNRQVLGGAVAWAFVFFTLGSLPLMVAFMWLVRNRLVTSWAGGEWLARQFPWPRCRPLDSVELKLCSKY